ERPLHQAALGVADQKDLSKCPHQWIRDVIRESPKGEKGGDENKRVQILWLHHPRGGMGSDAAGRGDRTWHGFSWGWGERLGRGVDASCDSSTVAQAPIVQNRPF